MTYLKAMATYSVESMMVGSMKAVSELPEGDSYVECGEYDGGQYEGCK